MSESSPEPENTQSTEEQTESPVTEIAKPIDENGIMAEHTEDDGGENTEDEPVTEFPVNGIEEPEKTCKKMDMPSLELSDNEFNSNDSDSFASRALKNRNLELKLSAIIEKACSSDFEAEDPPEVQPPLPVAKDPLEVKPQLPVAEDPPEVQSTLPVTKDPPGVQPTLPVANVTVTLPNNQLLFTVEGVNVPAEVANDSSSQEIAVPPAEQPNPAPARKKKYVYKLKSKAGGVLMYTSYVPIVLKKPRITLTRIDLSTMVKDEAATKGRGKRKAPAASPVVNGKRGRPAKKAASPAIVEDAADTTDAKLDESKSFGMQTRKRKLKFLPDGRLLCVAKRRRSSSSTSTASSIDDDDPPAKESTDEDWEATGEDLKELHAISESNEPLPEIRSAGKSQNSKSTKSVTPKQAKAATPKPAPPKPAPKLVKSASPKLVKYATPKLSKLSAVLAQDGAGKVFFASKATGGTVASTPTRGIVNPAQLLSTLLGVTIRPSQLNMVRFKPKSVQKQHPSMQKTMVLTGEELKGVAANFRAAAGAKTTPKPLMQKILPKLSLTSILNKTVNTKSSPSAQSIWSAAPSDLVSPAFPPAPEEVIPEVPSFDDFTDSRTVRTKAGPKKFLVQKERLELGASEKLNRLTIYDLAQNVFDRMPSWNLHIMPDTNTFCIAQVGRGRMGIPILRKSVELNDNFSAKIFVHQLHCKKFDGVYDTEAKINSLMADIESL